MGNWEKIFSIDKVHLAAIVKDLLDENQLEPVMMNKKDNAYLFGNVEIYVVKENIMKAMWLIKENINRE